MSNETPFIEDELKPFVEITFHNCSLDYNSTIVPNFRDVADYLQMVSDDLEDPDNDAKVTIQIVPMSEKSYNKWHKENVKP